MSISRTRAYGAVSDLMAQCMGILLLMIPSTEYLHGVSLGPALRGPRYLS